jgi:hypothetical protein
LGKIFLFLLALALPFSAGAQSTEGQLAFEKTAHTFLKRQCAVCHGDTQSPLFAVNDVAKAYSAAFPYVNFQDIAKSKIISQSKNGHCGLENCQTSGVELTGLIVEWAKQEKIEEIRLRTPAVYMPLVPLNTLKVLTWDLSSIAPNLQKAFFTIEVFGFSEDAVLFKKPRLITRNSAVYLQDFRIEIDGTALHKEKFRGVTRVILPNAADGGFPVLSVNTDLVSAINEGTPLRISFKSLKVQAKAMRCHSPEIFETKIYPVLTLRNCFYCHGGGPSRYPGTVSAKASFDMNTDVGTLCKNSIQRSDPLQPIRSPMIWYALGNGGSHPRVIPFMDDVEPDWTNWISSIIWE